MLTDKRPYVSAKSPIVWVPDVEDFKYVNAHVKLPRTGMPVPGANGSRQAKPQNQAGCARKQIGGDR